MLQSSQRDSAGPFFKVCGSSPRWHPRAADQRGSAGPALRSCGVSSGVGSFHAANLEKSSLLPCRETKYKAAPPKSRRGGRAAGLNPEASGEPCATSACGAPQQCRLAPQRLRLFSPSHPSAAGQRGSAGPAPRSCGFSSGVGSIHAPSSKKFYLAPWRKTKCKAAPPKSRRGGRTAGLNPEASGEPCATSAGRGSRRKPVSQRLWHFPVVAPQGREPPR